VDNGGSQTDIGGMLHQMEYNQLNSNSKILFTPLDGSTATLSPDLRSTPLMVSQTQHKTQSNFVCNKSGDKTDDARMDGGATLLIGLSCTPLMVFQTSRESQSNVLCNKSGDKGDSGDLVIHQMEYKVGKRRFDAPQKMSISAFSNDE
jgi:hypothetical protein